MGIGQPEDQGAIHLSLAFYLAVAVWAKRAGDAFPARGQPLKVRHG
jgi:hypothetical protein